MSVDGAAGGGRRGRVHGAGVGRSAVRVSRGN
jgi:hypothetical protein